MSKRNAPRPVPSEDEGHPYRPELPAPSWARDDARHSTLSAEEILALPDAQLRVAEVCKGHCQADEVAEWHLYVRDRLLVPFAATWSDPDEPDSGPQAVEVRAVREEADRRGVMVLCAIDGTQRTRWIGLEWLYVAEVRDEDWDASNALHVAARVLADYNFWVNELHGLDPSPLFFDDDDGSMMGGHALPFDLVDDDEDGSYYSFSEEPGNSPGAHLHSDGDAELEFLLDQEDGPASDHEAMDRAEDSGESEGSAVPEADNDDWRIAYSDDGGALEGDAMEDEDFAIAADLLG